MVRPNDVVGIAARIGGALSKVDGKQLYRWGGYDGNADKLFSYDQEKDDAVHFSRKDERKARIHLTDIQPSKMRNTTVTKPITLKSEPKRAASVSLTNDLDVEQEMSIEYEFTYGKETIESIKVGSALESKTTIGTGEASSVKFEQEITATVTNEWTKQTGIKNEEGKKAVFPVKVPPKCEIEAWIEWSEDTLQRHIKADAAFECKIQIGKRDKRSNGHWGWNGDKKWNSLSELASVLEGRGSVHADLGDYFYKHKDRRPSEYAVGKIRDGPYRKYDQVVEYKAADKITVKYKKIRDL